MIGHIFLLLLALLIAANLTYVAVLILACYVLRGLSTSDIQPDMSASGYDWRHAEATAATREPAVPEYLIDQWVAECAADGCGQCAEQQACDLTNPDDFAMWERDFAS